MPSPLPAAMGEPVSRVTRPRYESIVRVLGGFLQAAIARGEFVEAKIKGRLDDMKVHQGAGLLNSGSLVFTASGDKP